MRIALCFLASLFLASASGQTFAPRWIATHEELTDGAKEIYQAKIAADSAGGVIVATTTNGGRTGEDLLVRKHIAATGALVWERRYDGPIHSPDRLAGLALDSAGNALVLAAVYGANEDEYFYVAKYAAGDGALLWERRLATEYGGYPYAIACDAAGDAIVAGTANSASSRDLYLAKCAGSSGAVLWERHHAANTYPKAVIGEGCCFAQGVGVIGDATVFAGDLHSPCG